VTTEVRLQRWVGTGATLICLGVVPAFGYGTIPSPDVVPVIRMQVIVTASPLDDFVRNIGGDKVQVSTLAPAVPRPKGEDLSPGQVAELNNARLFVSGLGSGYWRADLSESVTNPDLIVVYVPTNPSKADVVNPPVIQGIFPDGFTWKLTRDKKWLEVEGVSFSVPALDIQSRTCPGEICRVWKAIKVQMADSGGAYQASNSNVWLDLLLARRQVEAITVALVQADPDNIDFYTRNSASYVEQLDALAEKMESLTATFGNKDFMSLDPQWACFADRFGMTLSTVIEVGSGSEINRTQIAGIVDNLRRLEGKVLFVGPQVSQEIAETIAAESGGKVVFVDEGRRRKSDEANGYLATVSYNMDRIATAMSN
jgi:ABC-type Zn uptake system ZnuABC Zn-binding protein ZnuA